MGFPTKEPALEKKNQRFTFGVEWNILPQKLKDDAGWIRRKLYQDVERSGYIPQDSSYRECIKNGLYYASVRADLDETKWTVVS